MIKKQNSYILGIETSCDDTAFGIISSTKKEIIANEIINQDNFHGKYGGVVPELASRTHLQVLQNLLPMIFQKYGITSHNISHIAVTHRPGLIGSLLIGVNYAKTLAWAWEIEFTGTDHLEGHILSALFENEALDFPYICLLISGGHTLIVLVNDLGKYTILGKTLDDAVGESFDKVATMLGYEYPGGPIVDTLAQQCKETPFEFPIPMKNSKTLEMSFSGLKTAVLYTIRDLGIEVTKEHRSLTTQQKKLDNNTLNLHRKICAGFQNSVAESLFCKCSTAIKKTGIKNFALVGGSAMNSGIRKKLGQYCQEKNINFFVPSSDLCRDNGVMIAFIVWLYQKYGKLKTSDLYLNPLSHSKLFQG